MKKHGRPLGNTENSLLLFFVWEAMGGHSGIPAKIHFLMFSGREAMGGHSGIPAKIHFLMFSGREAMGGHSGIPAKIHFLMFSGREATGGHGNTEIRANFDLNPFFVNVRTQNAPLFWEKRCICRCPENY